MKMYFKLYLAIALLAVNPPTIQAQDTTKVDSLAKLNNAVDSLTENINHLKQFVTDLSSRTEAIEKVQAAATVATLRMRDSVLLYDNNKNATAKILPIDSIFISMFDGFISNIVVYAGRYRFTNKRAPIAFTAKRFENRDFLYSLEEDADNRSYCILYNAIMDFKSPHSYGPDDTTIVLTKDNKTAQLKKGTMLNTILDLRLYTDALGLLGNESNGIVQAEGHAKFFIHQSNVPDHSSFLAHYINTNVGWSKFDSKAAYMDRSNYSRSRLLQNAYFHGEVALNLFDWFIGGKTSNTFYFDIGGSINATRFSDSTTADSLKIFQDSLATVISPNLFAEAGFHIKCADNFGLHFSIRAITNYSPQTEIIDSSRNKHHYFIRPSFEAYYNPWGNKAGRVFVRANYWMDTHSLTEEKNHFFQFQIGYNITLSQLK